MNKTFLDNNLQLEYALFKIYKYERVTWPAHSGSTCPRQRNVKMSAVEFTRPLDVWPSKGGGEIKSQLNQLSAHVVNFRSKQLDSAFKPKDEITGPADHSIIITNKKKLKSKEWTNMGLNNEIIMDWVKKNICSQSRNNCYHFDVPFPVNTSGISRNLAPILLWSV